MRNAKTLNLPQPEHAENRILATVEIKVNNQWVYVINTHLDALKSDINRIAQAKFIINHIQQSKLPIILCGDLNIRPTSTVINLLNEHLTATCIDDCKPTAPQINPRNVIDYIYFKNADWQVKNIEVIDEKFASDHRPVKAN